MATMTPLEAFLEVTEDYNITVYSLVSSAENYGPESVNPSRRVDSELCFPELASSSMEFATKLLGFMDISCSLADAIIKALQSLTSQSLASIEIHPYDGVLHVIEDTIETNREIRAADNEVLRKCMELPLERVEAALADETNKGIEAERELQIFEFYPDSLTTRNALPVEDCLEHRPLASKHIGLCDRPISECEELIAQVGICARLWFKPLEQHLRIFSHPLFENVNKGMVEDEVLCGKNNHLVDMATWYIKSDHMSYEELNLVFDRDVLSAIVYFAEPLPMTSGHLFNEAIRSYTSILGFTYELVALRFKLYVHIAWRIPAALLLRDPTKALQPVSNLHESLVSAQDKATTQIEKFKNLASQLKEVYPSHGNSLYPVTEEAPGH
ncbi:hypothetical protein D9756_010687 [Leucocoprinus leucothites]|uniref:Uncharacterized protein n=1 Tax=Leucocoprinus leucothites TaxID=201217 RepID=A0A8H5CT67_9AGAR|nr:hypothetical protein D9756_010687 [Leucoagaricus leucothites]